MPETPVVTRERGHDVDPTWISGSDLGMIAVALTVGRLLLDLTRVALGDDSVIVRARSRQTTP